MTAVKPISGPHTRAAAPIPWIMRQVMLALLPCTAFGILLYGWPALWLFTITVLASAGWEALSVKLAGRKAFSTLADGSALLTGWLVALSLPPWAPWWIGVSGGFIAIVLGKQVYGGLGQNLFNPAMLARVALLVSFPVEMTTWVTPHGIFGGEHQGLFESFGITFGHVPEVDGVTGATFLGAIKTGFTEGQTLSATLAAERFGLASAWFGLIRGSLGETSTVLILAGGLYLLRQRVITWHIPVSMLLAVAAAASIGHLVDPERYADAGFHLGSGALMLVAFFIATDYVTSPNSPAGQLLFGAGCGLIVWVIRSFGGYPEGTGFAILLMNAMTPLIDHYVRPRIYGRDRRGRPLELP